ncbi:hypothetical protein HanIR_Chr04g0154661 [Helianthus annuus]|nr:hypothetical protein HanIR_Chr04g0154661 [Helianthus annuus]
MLDFISYTLKQTPGALLDYVYVSKLQITIFHSECYVLCNYELNQDPRISKLGIWRGKKNLTVKWIITLLQNEFSFLWNSHI